MTRISTIWTRARVAELKQQYEVRKDEIRSRLKEFEKKLRASEDELLAELCFCLFTPQSKAVMCDRAMSALKECGLLLEGSERQVADKMNGVRFRNQKACYLVEARSKLRGTGDGLRGRIQASAGNTELREWLVDNIKGLGYKEASHFLRNIGMGRGLAILDRHVLKNLAACGVLDELPASLSRKKYLEIETKMKRFCSDVGIDMEELDLLFWSMETGMVFK